MFSDAGGVFTRRRRAASYPFALLVSLSLSSQICFVCFDHNVWLELSDDVTGVSMHVTGGSCLVDIVTEASSLSLLFPPISESLSEESLFFRCHDVSSPRSLFGWPIELLLFFLSISGALPKELSSAVSRINCFYLRLKTVDANLLQMPPSAEAFLVSESGRRFLDLICSSPVYFKSDLSSGFFHQAEVTSSGSRGCISAFSRRSSYHGSASLLVSPPSPATRVIRPPICNFITDFFLAPRTKDSIPVKAHRRSFHRISHLSSEDQRHQIQVYQIKSLPPTAYLVSADFLSDKGFRRCTVNLAASCCATFINLSIALWWAWDGPFWCLVMLGPNPLFYFCNWSFPLGLVNCAPFPSLLESWRDYFLVSRGVYRYYAHFKRSIYFLVPP